MKLKTLVMAGILALGSMSIAFAKSYDITFSTPTKVGSVEFKAGDYRLTINGTKAVFTTPNDKKVAELEVKLETSAKKFDQTIVETDTQAGKATVKDIQLGGSKTQVTF